MPNLTFAEMLRKERLARRAAAASFVNACKIGDVEALYQAADRINDWTVDGWVTALRKLVREVREVDPKIQSAFLRVWIESKMLPLRVGDHRALCEAAKVLLPRYQGPAVRLFRGAGSPERRRRIYGVAWSADVRVAERFAKERRGWPGGSVLLETLASPKAIISRVDYPEPFTDEEIKEFKREDPNIETVEFHEEREYVVDRRHLNSVTVVRRYSEIKGPPPPQLQGLS